MPFSKKPGAEADADATSGRKDGPGVPEAHDEIAVRLRALYSETESQPIPNHLIELLERLDEAEKGDGNGEPA